MLMGAGAVVCASSHGAEVTLGSPCCQGKVPQPGQALHLRTLKRDSPVPTGLFANAASELSPLCTLGLGLCCHVGVCLQAMFQIIPRRLDFLARLSSPLLGSVCGSFPCPKRLPAAPGADPAALEEGVAVLLTKSGNVKFAIYWDFGGSEVASPAECRGMCLACDRQGKTTRC